MAVGRQAELMILEKLYWYYDTLQFPQGLAGIQSVVA